MIRIDRICVWLFLGLFILMVPGFSIAKFVDELATYSLLGLTLLDIVVNGNWRRYIPTLVVVGIIIFYIIYTAAFMTYNTLPYVLMDAVIQSKPFLTCLIVYAIGPRFEEGDRKIIRTVAVIVGILAFIAGIGGKAAMSFLFIENTAMGVSCMVAAIAVIMVSRSEDGALRLSDFLTITLLLLTGLLCTRSKYYAEFIVGVALVLFYRQQMLSKLDWKALVGVLALVALVVLAVKDKFLYYFVSDAMETGDAANKLESFARPALYLGAFLTIEMHPLFGSGFASFASYASSVSYSKLYFDLGLYRVFGLSPTYSAFICDAYFASLAQVGIVGIALFIYFWVWTYGKLRWLSRSMRADCKFPFVAGVMAMVTALVESTTGNMLFSPPGVIAMMILGITASMGNRVKADVKAGRTGEPKLMPQPQVTPQNIII